MYKPVLYKTNYYSQDDDDESGSFRLVILKLNLVQFIL